MATEKKLNTRIINKHDDTSKWNSSSFVPKEGEIIIVDDDSKKIKIGDGKTAAKNLPFLDAVKADQSLIVGDNNCKIYPEIDSEINFGGNNSSDTIYFGYREKDNKSIPAKFVFGGANGSATLQAKTFSGNATSADKATSIIDSNNKSEINIRYGGSGINSASWFPAWTSEGGKNTLSPISAERLRMAINAAEDAPAYEANLKWGGKNFSADYGCIDAAMIPDLGSNRFAFLKAEGITVEYSRDNGSTWHDYGLTNDQKVGLFSTGCSCSIGKTEGASYTNNKYLLKVIINTDKAGIYTYLNKFCIYCSTSGSSGTYCSIEAALESTPDSYEKICEKVPIAGWSGYNIINISGLTTYGNSPAYQYGRIKFIFGCTKHESTYSGLSISKIMGFGGVGWSTPSNMASNGHLYSYDSQQNAFFPKGIYSQGTKVSINGHTHSKNEVGLSNVDNTADSQKSVKQSGLSLSVQAGSGTADADRAVWYSDSVDKTKMVQSDNFKYNPATNTLTVGNITGNAKYATTAGTAKASDVYAWAKASSKPKYNYNEVGAAPAHHTHGNEDITSLDAAKLTGTISIDRLPQGALERLVTVANQAARFKLTNSNVQLGDTVQQLDNKRMYIVTDTSKLSSEAGYTEYTAGSAASVPWNGVSGKPSTFTPSAHTHDDRYYTESEMNSKLAEKSNTGHTHDDRYYTESEMNSKLADKMTLHPSTIVMTPTSGTYGCKIDFASNDQGYAYIHEDASDHLKICGNYGINLVAASDATIKLNDKAIATQTWVEGKGYVTTDTKYSAGAGLNASGNTFSVKYGTSAGTACQGNDNRLTNPRPASDVYSWAKTSTKPTYSWNEIQSKPDVLDSTMTLILDGGTSTKNI